MKKLIAYVFAFSTGISLYCFSRFADEKQSEWMYNLIKINFNK